MVETLQDIENLETALVLITEGASDEKRMGHAILERMIANKKAQVKAFEDLYAPKESVDEPLLF